MVHKIVRCLNPERGLFIGTFFTKLLYIMYPSGVYFQSCGTSSDPRKKGVFLGVFRSGKSGVKKGQNGMVVGQSGRCSLPRPGRGILRVNISSLKTLVTVT